ncbi:MAG: S9 family peptidase [Candidatus Aminicenantes bacterium]|nr:S9 family peptidase [Candidatus Aminicenantes bacterium]
MKKNGLVFCLSIFLLTVLQGVHAFGKREAEQKLPSIIPRKVLFGNPVRKDPLISPDGTWLSYLAPSEEGVMNIWVRSLSKKDDRQVTEDKHRGIHNYCWAEDSQNLFYLQDSDGDENDHVYLINLKSGNIRDLTPFQGVKAVNLFVKKNFILVGLNLRNRRLFDMYKIDISSGKTELDTENPGDVVYLIGKEWTADSEGIIRAVKAMDLKTGGAILRVRKTKDAPWREIRRWPLGALFDGYITGFSEDGQSLLVTSSEDSDKTKLVELDTETGEVLRVVAEDSRCDILPESFVVDPHSGYIQGYEVDYLKPEWKVVDENIASDFARLKSFTRGHFTIKNRDRSDSKWMISVMTDDGPTSFYLYDRTSGKIEFLFDDRPKLKKYKLARMEPVIILARDGLELVSYLTLPAGIEPKRLPMVLYVHGGPTAKDSWCYEPLVQMLANRGYAVLQVNFRGSVGFGKKFQTAGNMEVGVGSMQHDLTDAVTWAVKQGIADPGRVGIYGGSYGGYAVLAGLAFTPGLYACGAEACGPSHLKTFMEAIPPYWGPMKEMFKTIFGDPENDPEYNKARSPIHHVDKIRVPLLIGQGGNDPRCNIKESEQIVEAMRQRDLPVTYVVYTDEGHGFVRPENELDFYGRLDVFFGKYLGGRYEPFEKIDGSSAQLR